MYTKTNITPNIYRFETVNLTGLFPVDEVEEDDGLTYDMFVEKYVVGKPTSTTRIDYLRVIYSIKKTNEIIDNLNSNNKDIVTVEQLPSEIIEINKFDKILLSENTNLIEVKQKLETIAKTDIVMSIVDKLIAFDNKIFVPKLIWKKWRYSWTYVQSEPLTRKLIEPVLISGVNPEKWKINNVHDCLLYSIPAHGKFEY